VSELVCPRRGKWIGGCRFEARYDYRAPTTTSVKSQHVDDTIQVIEASKARDYVRDICVTCGRTVERDFGVGGLDQSDMPYEA
jgi:hypothetical protein